MTRNAQAQSTRLATIIIGSAAILLFIPIAAWAGSGDYDYDRHRTSSDYRWQYGDAGHRHVSHKRHHRAFHKRHHYASHKRNHPRGKRRGYEKHAVGYYCEPCNHYFSARDELYDHVAYRHDVPFRHLSLAVSFGAFGWIFFG
jgi:hypothetical protein